MSVKNQHIIEGTEGALQKFKTTIFELIPRGRSSFVKEGTGGETGIPAQYLSTNKNLMLEPISRLYLGKGNGYRATQYVVGASTIYVEDYYEDSAGALVLENVSIEEAKKRSYQMRPGLKSQNYNLKEEYIRSMDKAIGFESGQLDASRYGDDPMLVKFLMEHEQNIEAPRAKENSDPNRLKLFSFKPSIPEREAAKSSAVQSLDDQLDALTFVSQLRTKKGNGSYQYNEEKMDAVLSILENGVGLKQGDVNQKFEIIARVAQKNGSEFITLVEGVMEQYKTQIATAVRFKVLDLGAKEVKVLKDMKLAPIYSFSAADLSKDGCIDELVVYFLASEKGRADFSDLAREIEKAKVSAVN